ncbi:MAG: methyl-accepting chemotaxis protein, partial [Mariprofundaceae bacterium]|nr:methyl-accepting chemotaxis protein [Mariprofundaceae bacterium]
NELNSMFETVFAKFGAALASIEKGQLMVRMDNEYQGVFDQMTQAINRTAEKLAEVLIDVRNTAMNVADGSSEISNGNSTLSDRTQEQAAALEETSASVEELTGTVQQNADNARLANQLAMNTSEQAEEGRKVVAQAIDAVAGISQSSKKIADIIGVIDEIAFQTNLLALNAAVEAARAGEQGRGFAVVAGEVRTLAGRSAGAAKEIKELISASVESVEHGSKLVNDSGEALAEIVHSVQKVTDIIAEIAAASQEQSQGVDQINKAMTQLDSAVQQNAALVEETAASSANLDQESNDLLGLVDNFDLGEGQHHIKPSHQRSPIKTAPARSTPVSRSPRPTAAPQASSKPVLDDDVWQEF